MYIEDSANLILVTLCLYFLTIVGLGIYYSRRAKSTDDFILASHSLSTPFVTGSVVATWLGGAVILGGATEAFPQSRLRRDDLLEQGRDASSIAREAAKKTLARVGARKVDSTRAAVLFDPQKRFFGTAPVKAVKHLAQIKRVIRHGLQPLFHGAKIHFRLRIHRVETALNAFPKDWNGHNHAKH